MIVFLLFGVWRWGVNFHEGNSTRICKVISNNDHEFKG